MRGGPQAPLDLPANKVFQAWKAERGPRERSDPWDLLERRGHLGPEASPAPKEPLGTQDPLV